MFENEKLKEEVEELKRQLLLLKEIAADFDKMKMRAKVAENENLELRYEKAFLEWKLDYPENLK